MNTANLSSGFMPAIWALASAARMSSSASPAPAAPSRSGLDRMARSVWLRMASSPSSLRSWALARAAATVSTVLCRSDTAIGRGTPPAPLPSSSAGAVSILATDSDSDVRVDCMVAILAALMADSSTPSSEKGSAVAPAAVSPSVPSSSPPASFPPRFRIPSTSLPASWTARSVTSAILSWTRLDMVRTVSRSSRTLRRVF
mmetsp:Transcript_14563/g.41900  ORF Transcript_14563/g.41900 Transcript_14563/m.41900 type:complete len:201 (+) Transcript_14563:460-1062(+)